jgi:DNA-binding beta-propeller fold protein YncE
VAVTPNGRNLLYTNATDKKVGMVDISDPAQPRARPSINSPEGLLALPQRGLFVTANEVGSTISIFAVTRGLPPSDPFIVSNGISWSVLSGLSEGPGRTFYAVPDSIFAPSHIFTMSLGNSLLGLPTRITNVLTLPGNYDLEGIATRPGGGWWVVSEGAGAAGAPTATKNLLLQINPDGSLARAVELPAAVNTRQVQFGFEGVAVNRDGSQVYVAFQREWRDDLARLVKIGRFTPATGEWPFSTTRLKRLRPRREPGSGCQKSRALTTRRLQFWIVTIKPTKRRASSGCTSFRLPVLRPQRSAKSRPC